MEMQSMGIRKDGFMEYERVWTWYQEGTEELEDIMLCQEYSTR
jgi:hypothetical protein